MRRERLRLRLRERLADLSSSFSALLERERLLLFETEEASESSSRAIFLLGVSRRRRQRVRRAACCLSGYCCYVTRGCGDERKMWVQRHCSCTASVNGCPRVELSRRRLGRERCFASAHKPTSPKNYRGLPRRFS